MTIFIEDTPRNNLAAWSLDAVSRGLATGAILSPFTTPLVGNRYKQSAEQTVARLRDEGAITWVDPTTHALQMSGVGDFRYYDGWELWGGVRGDLDGEAEQRDHVRRVFHAQTNLGVPHLAPTVLLHAPESETSARALRLARIAKELDPGCFLSMAGTPPFWSSARSLDAHVGAMAQLVAGWFVTVVRPLTDLPVSVDPAEAYGVCRTVRSLSEYGPVHVSFGDLAALPAVAAGAASLGTGWDVRQRVSAYPNYGPRDPDAEGGGWFRRPTVERLFAVLPRVAAERLQQQRPDIADALVPGPLPPDAPQDAFIHHLASIGRLSTELQAGGDHRVAYETLEAMYAAAVAAWPDAQLASGSATNAEDWITPLREGLRRFAASEGWT